MEKISNNSTQLRGICTHFPVPVSLCCCAHPSSALLIAEFDGICLVRKVLASPQHCLSFPRRSELVMVMMIESS